MKVKKGYYCWHGHHNVLCEWCYDYDGRVATIKMTKPVNEIEPRLRLFQPVRGRLPIGFRKAAAAYIRERAAHTQAQAAYVQARAAYALARVAYEQDRERGAFDKAWAAYTQASAAVSAAFNQACAALNQAQAAFDQVKQGDEIKALHAKECGCKEWNGKELVFPACQDAPG